MRGADCRVRLEPIDTAVVLQLLDSATYRNHKTLLPGHVTAAEQAISYLAQLGREHPMRSSRSPHTGRTGFTSASESGLPT